LQRKGWLKGDKKFVDSISDYMELNRLRCTKELGMEVKSIIRN
jgi:hypothetical protein